MMPHVNALHLIPALPGNRGLLADGSDQTWSGGIFPTFGDAMTFAACELPPQPYDPDPGQAPGPAYKVFRWGLNGRYVWRVRAYGLTLQEVADEDAAYIRWDRQNQWETHPVVSVDAAALARNAEALRIFLEHA